MWAATDDPHVGSPPREQTLTLSVAAGLPVDQVLNRLGSSRDEGLTTGEATTRLAAFGPNAVTSHRTRPLRVLLHQLRSPLLGLLLVAAGASYLVGQRSDAVIIGVIVALSVGLGFLNEYRAERAAEALHSQVNHQAVVIRDGQPSSVNITDLVPGDVVRLSLGQVVPADLRLIDATALECDESMMTGESQPVEKITAPVRAGAPPLAELSSAALMGTIVHAGSGRGVVVATGRSAAFGSIAAGLSTHPLDTAFQAGLARFSMLLVYVGASLTTMIFVANVALHRPVLDALLFSLAIAVGITPSSCPPWCPPASPRVPAG